MTKIAITLGGSRGDLQPYLALALGLQNAGAEVRIVTAGAHESFVRERGLDFAPVSLDTHAVVTHLLEQQPTIIGFMKGMTEQLGQKVDENLCQYAKATADADTILYGASGGLGQFAARHLGIPTAMVELQPILRPTSAYRSSLTPAPPGFVRDTKLESLYNRLSYVGAHEAAWHFLKPHLNRGLSNVFSLPPLQALDPFRSADPKTEPGICAWSPTILPRPSDYGDHLHVTGYCFLDTPTTWSPSAQLLDFFDSGPPPISIGFGSMKGMDPEWWEHTLVNALRKIGRRAVLLTGWGELGQVDWPDDIFQTPEVPHDWLFPKVATVVHHGGAGTTAAALRAGTPQVVVPFFFDQMFWGETIATLGAGSNPLPRKTLSSHRLADAVAYILSNPAVVHNARQLGAKVRAENGVNNAISTLRRHKLL